MINFIIGFLIGFLVAWQLVKHRLWVTFINEVLDDVEEEDLDKADFYLQKLRQLIKKGQNET